MADSSSIRVVARICAALALVVALFCAVGAPAQAQVVVSLTFDDGAATQYREARPALLARGLQATFYVNSGFIHAGPESPTTYYMTWSQLAQLAAEGHEIGGHSLDNKSLTTEITDPEGRRHAICDDRQNLIAHGFQPVSFSYPHGNFNAAVEQIVYQCGYASARLIGGLYDSQCVRCPVAESLPPRDPYAVGSNSDVTGQWTADALKGYVVRAAAGGGGWVPLNVRDVCYAASCPAKALAGSISPPELSAFLDWLVDGAPAGTTVKTVHELVSAPPASFVSHPVLPFGAPRSDKVTAFGAVKVRKRQDIDNIHVLASMLEPGTLRASGQVKAGRLRAYRLKRASKPARPGKLVRLRLRLSKRDLRAAKRALRTHRRVRARVTITARDKPGNRQRAKRTIVLHD